MNVSIDRGPAPSPYSVLFSLVDKVPVGGSDPRSRAARLVLFAQIPHPQNVAE